MIQRIEDTATTEIKNIVSDLEIETTFVMANLKEANFIADSVSTDTIALFIPITQSRSTINESGLHIRTIPINIYFLTRLDNIDTTSDDLDPIISEMRQLAEQFLKYLNKSNSTYAITESFSTAATVLFDSALAGVRLSFDWNFNTNKGVGC